MAHAGDTIENPVDGQRLVFVRTVEDMGEDELAIEYYIPPGTPAVPAHVHLASEETFEVLAGTLEVWTGARRNRRRLQAGERITLVPHIAGWSGVIHWERKLIGPLERSSADAPTTEAHPTDHGGD